jgi:hypothetical protein
LAHNLASHPFPTEIQAPVAIDARDEERQHDALLHLISGMLGVPRRLLRPSVVEAAEENARRLRNIQRTNMFVSCLSVLTLAALMFLVWRSIG